MVKVIAVGGVPGTGKTTLFWRLLDELATDFVLKEVHPLVPAHYSKSTDTYILGKYEKGEVFAGTDRMSMAVQPKACEFINNLPDGSVVLFEGDRLFNQSFLEFLLENERVDLSIVVLETTKDILTERYKERGSNQDATFLKSRGTKVGNITGNFDLRSVMATFTNTHKSDQDKVVEFIKSRIK